MRTVLLDVADVVGNVWSNLKFVGFLALRHFEHYRGLPARTMGKKPGLVLGLNLLVSFEKQKVKTTEKQSVFAPQGTLFPFL